MRRELSYDGKGINGPDEHRSRVATFANAEAAEKYGRLFEAAPELLESLEALLESPMLIGSSPYALKAYRDCQVAIAKAKPATATT